MVLFRYCHNIEYSDRFSDSMQVRGTPASGKTTLADLLRRYITNLERNTDVIYIPFWPKDRSLGLELFLAVDHGWVQTRETVFIFDNAESTYNDNELWVSLFKDTPNFRTRRVIIFTSFGSPNSRILLEDNVTPIQLAPAQRVNLHPVSHNDGLPPVGLFLTWDEFNDLTRRRYPGPEYRFHRDFLEEVFKFTVGHVGAVLDFLSVTTAHDVGLCYVPRTVDFTCLLVISGSQVQQ
jgi:hypothetical protein